MIESPLRFALASMSMIVALGITGGISHAQTSMYAEPELGLSFVGSTLSGTYSGVTTSGPYAQVPVSVVPYFDVGLTLNEDMNLGVRASSVQGLSFDIGDKDFIRASVFADLTGFNPSPVAGLARPGPAIETGGRVTYRYDLFEVGALASYIFASPFGEFDAVDTAGFRGELWAGANLPLSRKFNLSGQVALGFADASHNGYFYGVTPAMAAQSGLAEYAPGAGLTVFSTRLTGRYTFTANWAVQAGIEMQSQIGVAWDSPLVIEAGRIGWQGDLTLIYRF